jgi:hypothetical protein
MNRKRIGRVGVINSIGLLKVSSIVLCMILYVIVFSYQIYQWQYHLAIMLVITIINYFACNKDISSPSVWLNPSIVLYHYSAIILNDYDYFNLKNQELYTDVTIVSMIIANIVLVIGSKYISSEGSRLKNFNIHPYQLQAIEILWRIINFIAISTILYYIAFIGVSKVDATLLGFYRLEIIQNWYAYCFAILLLCRIHYSKRITSDAILAIFISVFWALALGQRNMLAQVVVSLVTILSFFKLSRPIVLAGILTTSAGVLTILSSYRNVFSVGVSVLKKKDQPFWVDFLTGEPLSAGRNMDILLSYIDSSGPRGYQTLINDFASAFIPKFLIYIENGDNWFSKRFFPEIVAIGGGQGYTLLGSFYAGFGYPSLIIMTIIVCMFLLAFKGNLKYNIYVFGFSVSLVVPISFAMRSDISALIGIVPRSMFPIMIAHYLITYMISRKYIKMTGSVNASNRT